MTHKKLNARVLALALTTAMVGTMLSSTVFAEGDAVLGTGSTEKITHTITAFDELGVDYTQSVPFDGHTYALTVKLGTPIEEIKLPTELGVTAEKTTTTTTPPAKDEVVDSGEAPKDTAPAGEPKQDQETTVTETAQETIPVTWSGDRAYTPNQNSKVIYTPVLPEGYALADGAKLPTIYVMVGRQARAATPVKRTTPLDFTKAGLSYVASDGTTSQTADPTTSSITDTGEGWSWNSGTKTLTLSNMTLEVSTASVEESFGIQLPPEATIQLADQTVNTVIASPSATGLNPKSMGILGTQKLYIKGSGTLKTSGAAQTDGSSFGIYVTNKDNISELIISEMPTITTTGSDSTLGISCGIFAETKISILGGNVTATAGKAKSYSIGIYMTGAINGPTEISGTAIVHATGGESTDRISAGVLSYDGDVSISGNAQLTATGVKALVGSYGISADYGSVVASNDAVVISQSGDSTTDDSYGSYGIFARKAINFTDNADVTATAGAGTANASYGSYGIYGKNVINFTDKAKVTATAGNAGAGGYSSGIYADLGMNVSGTANITATGGTVEQSEGRKGLSYGIHLYDNSAISGGTVTATAGAADTSCGIFVENGFDLNISDGTVTATAGAANTSYGIRVDPAPTHPLTISGGTGTASTTDEAVEDAKGAFNVQPEGTLGETLVNFAAQSVSWPAQSDSTITPTTATFDKYTSAAGYADVAVTQTLNGNTLSAIKNGATALASGTDYTVSGNSITIKKEYLAKQAVGTTTLTFDYSAGTDPTLAITVSDSTPVSTPDKTALNAAITEANNEKSGIATNNASDPSSVANGTKYVSDAQMKALTDAIAAAQTVADNSDATAADITAAVTALNTAIDNFKAAIKTGTYTSGGTGGDGTGGTGGTGGGGSGDNGSSGGSSGGGLIGGGTTPGKGSSSGSSPAGTAGGVSTPGKTVIDSPVASQGATNAIAQAVNNAIATGKSNQTVLTNFANYTAISKDGLKTINDAAAKAANGKNITLNTKIQLDHKIGNVVISRVTVDPVKLAAVMPDKLGLGVRFNQQKDVSVTALNNLFDKHFGVKTVSVLYDEKSPLAVSAEFCGKLNLEETFGENQTLYFYSYDLIKNTYTRINNPDYWRDKGAFSHITAPLGGCIVITNELLDSK